MREDGGKYGTANGKMGKGNLIIPESEKQILCSPPYRKNVRYEGHVSVVSLNSSSEFMICNQGNIQGIKLN